MASRIGAEYAEFDALRLGEGPVLPNLGQALADRRVVWVVDVDVGAGTRVGRLVRLVATALFLLVKGNLHGLFLKESAFDVLSLFLVDGVLAWTWIAEVSLSRERGVKLILPEVATLRRTHEWIHVLASLGRANSILRVLNGGTHCAGLTPSRISENVGVMTGTRFIIFYFGVFAVGHI